MRAACALAVGLFVLASISAAWSGPMVSVTPAAATPAPMSATATAFTPTPTPVTPFMPALGAQALAGAKVFAAHCASCHGAQLEGGAGPALVGPDFTSEISQERLTLGDVFGMVAYQMPYDAPASLSHVDYENVVAFLLVRNGQRVDPPGIVYDRALKSTVPFILPTP